MKRRALALVLLTVIAADARAGTAEGLAALEAKNYETARKEFETTAKEGDLEAYFQLGQIYLFGRGVKPDRTRGANYVKHAALRGHVPAAKLYGNLHITGEGTIIDRVEAVAWISYAANQGDQEARQAVVSWRKMLGKKQEKADRRVAEVEADIKKQIAKDQAAKAAAK